MEVISRRLLEVILGEVLGSGGGDSSRREHKHTATRAEAGAPAAGAAGGFDGKQTNPNRGGGCATLQPRQQRLCNRHGAWRVPHRARRGCAAPPAARVPAGCPALPPPPLPARASRGPGRRVAAPARQPRHATDGRRAGAAAAAAGGAQKPVNVDAFRAASRRRRFASRVRAHSAATAGGESAARHTPPHWRCRRLRCSVAGPLPPPEVRGRSLSACARSRNGWLRRQAEEWEVVCACHLRCRWAGGTARDTHRRG